MAEVGWVAFASCTLDIDKQVMPMYRSKFSKHTFTQPQVLAILCWMRYEDWTFRETKVRLSEHSEWRRALSLEPTPEHTTFYRFMQRLDVQVIRQAWWIRNTNFSSPKSLNAVLSTTVLGWTCHLGFGR
jgi:hypothetical protein